MASQVAVFPLLSVTVKITVFDPISSQPKFVWLILKVRSSSQLSKLPPSTSSAVIVATPVSSNAIVIFSQSTVGGASSTIVTVVVQVATLPLASVAVMVIVCSPSCVQSQVSISNSIKAVASQLSGTPRRSSSGFVKLISKSNNSPVSPFALSHTASTQLPLETSPVKVSANVPPSGT